jgi:hypothetical protein
VRTQEAEAGAAQPPGVGATLMPDALSSPVPALDDLAAQAVFFAAHSFVPLPDLISPALVAELNAAIDRDRDRNPFMWFCEGSPDYNCNLLLTQPVFEQVVRHPVVLRLLDRLMGGPHCFEELSVRHTPGSDTARGTDWHRDRPFWPEHPLRLDYPQVILYTTDVDEGTHCFTIQPEPAAGPPAAPGDSPRFDFHGRAGSAILFNAAALHGRTTRRTERHRRIVQVYYGHPSRPSLSQVTLMPPRLWRDHPDAEVRRFYGKINRYTKTWLESLGIPAPDPAAPWRPQEDP